MKNSNIIISVVIVLLIAGGVTAYSFVNPESNILNLPSFTPNNDYESNSISESSENGENTNGDEKNGYSSRLSSSQIRNNVENSGLLSKVKNAKEAKKVAEEAIEEEGYYPGTPEWDKEQQMWIVKIFNENKEIVDTIGVETNGMTSRV